MFIENVWARLLSSSVPNAVFLAAVDSQRSHFQQSLCYCAIQQQRAHTAITKVPYF